MVRKHIALTAGVTAVAVASIIGTGVASAATATSSKTQSQRRETAAQRETNYEARLTKAVTDGKITAAQKSAILAEHTTLEAEYTAAKAKTGTDRQTAVRKVWSDAKAWAKANNIEVRYLIGFRPHLRG